jgi:ubiquinone biosynthesis monooxygenase Coq7
MEDGEAAHLSTFNSLLAERGVRPTLLSPIWRIAGFGLGAATALMGEKAAMACTAAVEEVIEDHYATQAETLAVADPSLAATVIAYREDELRHKETAIDHGARQTPGYGALRAAIQFGCRVAIRLSEKI